MYNSDYGLSRTVVKLPGLISSDLYREMSADDIIDVKFNVTETSGGSNYYVNIYPLTNTGWTESSVTWNNVGSYSSTSICSGKLYADTVTSFDITELVKSWKNGTRSASAGFIMIAQNESTYRSFASSETADTTLRPSVVMTYNPVVVLDNHEICLEEGDIADLSAVLYPEGYSNISWTVTDSTIASVTGSGTTATVTGNKLGTTTITAYVNIDGVPYYDECTVHVVIPNGTYFIKNKRSLYYANVKDDDVSLGAYVSQNEFDGENTQRWEINRLNDGYYTIKSVASPENTSYYLSVENNSAMIGANIVLRSGTMGYGMKWKIETTSSGGYKLTAKSAETNGYVINAPSSTVGSDLVQDTYVQNTSYYDEWEFTRMLPTNGCEMEYNPNLWTGITQACNCYGYAINNQVYYENKVWHKQVPGEFYSGDFNIEISKECIEECVRNDFQQYELYYTNEYTFEEIGRYEVCPEGSYKVALVIDHNDNNVPLDYHWYRQDADGLWSHKQGITPVKRTDYSDNIIVDPQLANCGPYEEFIGYYAVTPINGMYIQDQNQLMYVLLIGNVSGSQRRVEMRYNEYSDLILNQSIYPDYNIHGYIFDSNFYTTVYAPDNLLKKLKRR